jgi:hypothetical protein
MMSNERTTTPHRKRAAQCDVAKTLHLLSTWRHVEVLRTMEQT